MLDWQEKLPRKTDEALCFCASLWFSFQQLTLLAELKHVNAEVHVSHSPF